MAAVGVKKVNTICCLWFHHAIQSLCSKPSLSTMLVSDSDCWESRDLLPRWWTGVDINGNDDSQVDR